MNNKEKALQSLEKIQMLLGDLGFTIDQSGYYKDYGLIGGQTVRISPIFDKGTSLDLKFNLSGISIAGHEVFSIIEGQPLALDKIPGECREDVMRMLAELAPGVLLPKTEVFIITMICNECKYVVSSYLNREGDIKCLRCLGYE